VTTGASGIFQDGDRYGPRMVTEWGMSDKLGPLRYSSDQEDVFLGHSVSQSKNMSDETASIVDAEVRRIVEPRWPIKFKNQGHDTEVFRH
jgi:cell division protease FtsH